MLNSALKQCKDSLPARECFITIGATAAFRSLLEQALSPSFLSTLDALSYTHLTVQCGPELSHFNTLLASTRQHSPHILSHLHIKSFDFNELGLGQEMLGCKRVTNKKLEGVVICHAGAGTILDAMRIGVPIIVIPNEELLDNHQEELAEELEKQGYVTYGKVNGLSETLRENEERSRSKTDWPPVNSGKRGVMGVVDEELGYENRAREMLD